MKGVIETIKEELKKYRDVSAWDKGVSVYAEEIMETVEEKVEEVGHEPGGLKELTDFMLNGAKAVRHEHYEYLRDDWNNASYGGFFLVYNYDIARRLCTPSEFKRFKQGDLNPNRRENWFDVQGKALYQAGDRIIKAYLKNLKK